MRKKAFGFNVSDLLGIAIMIIPCAISILWQYESSRRIIPFIPWFTKSVHQDIRPDLIAGLCSALFYGSLIIRYDIFKRENLAEAMISSVRTFLDCWVIAALIKVVIEADDGSLISIFALKFNTYVVLLLAIILSWIGLKTLAGYSWILFIIAGAKHLREINNAMGMLGAVFILTIFISMILQINNFSNIKDFMSDFRNVTNKYTSDVRESISAAADDASVRIQKTAKQVHKTAKQVGDMLTSNKEE